jgi:8-oxo-dGTP pyrophosphatase MutT (NUDIX family)
MRNTKIHRQYGGVPFAIGKGGRVRVVLLTSRQTGRWVIPKGWPMAGRKPTQAAVREAYEEAGLIGPVSPLAITAIGSGFPRGSLSLAKLRCSCCGCGANSSTGRKATSV